MIEIGRAKYLEPILVRIDELKKQTVNTINEAIGTRLMEQSLVNGDQDIIITISTHRSDLIRCWASYTVGKNPNLNIAQKLAQIKQFAADKHLGVRGICWLAARSSIAKDLSQSIAILKDWANNEDGNIRRFASEAT